MIIGSSNKYREEPIMSDKIKKEFSRLETALYEKKVSLYRKNIDIAKQALRKAVKTELVLGLEDVGYYETPDIHDLLFVLMAKIHDAIKEFLADPLVRTTLENKAISEFINKYSPERDK